MESNVNRTGPSLYCRRSGLDSFDRGSQSRAAERDSPKAPRHKPRVAATEACRDEMPYLPTEATRRPWQAPRASGATKQIARAVGNRAPSLRVSAQWHSSALLRL